MMAAGDILGGTDHGAVPEDIAAHGGMGFDDGVFHIRELFRIIEDRIGDADFADIMKEGRIPQVADALRIPAQPLRDADRILADAGGVALGIGILRIDGVGQGLDGEERDLLDLPGPLLGHGGLAGDFRVQALGMADLQEDIAMILDHGDGGEDRKAEICEGETDHEGGGVKGGQPGAEGGQRQDKIKHGIIRGKEDALFDRNEIAHADGQHQGPEDARALHIAGEGINGEHHHTEQGRDQDGLFPALQDPAAEGAGGAGDEGDNGHQDRNIREGKAADQGIIHDQHQAQQHREDADKGQGHQVLPEAVTDMDRLIQILPDRFDLLHKGRAAPLFHFYSLVHGSNAPWYQNDRAGSFCNCMKSFNFTMSQEVGSTFFG